MKIDFHSHAKMTKRICFSLEYTEYLFREISNCGLDAICLTEHFNSIEFNKVYKYISNKYDNIGDHFLVNGIKVFTGMEIDIKEGGHILIIGNINSILDINFKLKNNKEKNNFIVFKDLLNLLSPYNLIVGAAHPFRKKSIGKYDIDLKDAKGNLITKIFVDEVLKKPSGVFLEYYWQKPNKSTFSKKLGFLKLYKKFNWVIKSFLLRLLAK
jgi:tyrosine-protein phosphatase YwqE